MDKSESRPKYDPTMADQGWALFGRENKFTKMVLHNRVSREKFKETQQQQSFDKSREQIIQDRPEEFEQRVIYDPLTGMYNARSFAKKLTYELKRAKRYKRPLSLLVVSVDGLDAIRRQYGTLIIDDTLKACAKIVRGAVRDVDLPARCSEDKLAVIFPETYSSRAIVVGERIRERIRSEQINEDLRHLRVTVSVGIVSFPTHARDADDLMNKAIEYLEQASADGGDKVING